MRRYTITVNNQPLVVDVEAAGANLFRVQLDGRLIDVTLDDHRDLAHSAVTPALTPRADAPAAPPEPSPTAVAPAPSTSGPARSKLTAPMPGVVLSIDTTVGAKVARGDVVASLEAMKMVNQLRAPRDAVVAEIYVGAGDQVRYGETLVRFEDPQ